MVHYKVAKVIIPVDIQVIIPVDIQVIIPVDILFSPFSSFHCKIVKDKFRSIVKKRLQS
jgi:hypothetical protein